MSMPKHVVLLFGAAAVVAGVLTATPGRAHFVLVEPEAWRVQGVFGDPQKVGPCGNEGNAAETGTVTAYRPGDTIEVTVNERIFHPGHYRVALAINDQSELPPPPPITPVGGDPCGSVVIDESPVFPILADNLLPHSAPFDGPQTFTVTLPSDVTCTRCTLQVLEYMSSHGQPCFYHHCAEISIQSGPAPTPTLVTGDTCPGDCNGNGTVAVNEIILLVNIALGRAPIDSCVAGNADGNEMISINEIIAAVSRLLNGCE